jgi:hypothetical protein
MSGFEHVLVLVPSSINLDTVKNNQLLFTSRLRLVNGLISELVGELAYRLVRGNIRFEGSDKATAIRTSTVSIIVYSGIRTLTYSALPHQLLKPSRYKLQD